MPTDERYVIGLDSSTQSVKAIAWTMDGHPRAEGRAPHEILTPQPLHVEQDARSWWSAACTALTQMTRQIDPSRIDGIAISSQRETMVLLDGESVPLAPATLWLDRRAQDMIPLLAEEIGAERLHKISGKPVDIIPCIYRLRYMRQFEPHLLERAVQILGVHDFLTLKLTGRAAASWTSADPFGIFDIEQRTWSRELLDHLHIPVSKLPPLFPPAAQIGTVTAAAAAVTGLKAGTPVFAGGGDGHLAALGVNVIRPGTVYLNLGTAVVGGGWAETPAISRYWRTLMAPHGTGYLLESVQMAGTYFINWLLDNFAGGRDAKTFERLEREAAKLGIGCGGVTVNSNLIGCMDPHWDRGARASFAGLGPEAGIAHLYRAAMEAITLNFTRSLAEMKRLGVAARQIFVIGGGAGSPLWLKMVSDASGLPVIRSLSNEASALGAGMSAALGAHWYGSFGEAADAMSRLAERIEPDFTVSAEWEALSQRQDALYEATRYLDA